MRDDSLIHGDLTRQIIGVFFEVFRELGYGFLESVYRRAMFIALRDRDIRCVAEARHSVFFRGENVGDYRTDLLVDDRVIAEIKTSAEISHAHDAQLYNYLKASHIRVGLLLTLDQNRRMPDTY